MVSERDRYVLLFGGVASLVFGILLFTRTDATLALIMLLIGLSWLIQGVVSLLGVFINNEAWGWKLFSGVIGVVAGLFVLGNPLDSAVIGPALLAIIFGLFGVMIGIAALIAAFQGEGWGIGIFGAISLVIGLLMIFNSVISGQVIVWITAALLVIQGIVGIILSFIKPK
jgi:uncharacterized membrane protein HdeD (DUF308 family)